MISKDLSTDDVRRLLELSLAGQLCEDTDLLAAALQELLQVRLMDPRKMVLFCEHCEELHIDKLEPSGHDWSKLPHRTHLCVHCGKTWQPHPFPTVGVALPYSKTLSALEVQLTEAATALTTETGAKGLKSLGLLDARRKVRAFAEEVAGLAKRLVEFGLM